MLLCLLASSFLSLTSSSLLDYLPKMTVSEGARPNVILLLADDMGWRDVGFHVSDIDTPTLTEMAAGGTVFSNMYSQPICTPSRAALYTGKYPFRLGLQTGAILSGSRAALPLDQLTLPQVFKKAEYKTSLIGKWHLGFTTNQHTPVERGFDHFYGFYGGAQSYLTHSNDPLYGAVGYDFVREERDSTGNITRETIWSANNTYSTTLHTKEAITLIKKQDNQTPLFLLMSYQAPHGPLECLPEDSGVFNKSISNVKRRKYAGLMNSVDRSAADLREAVRKRGMENNTIWIFMSDNGGAVSVQGKADTAASNYPWRSGKGSVYEGGVKVPAFINGPGIPKGKTVGGLFHFIDWLPTLASLISVDLDETLDGVDQTDLIMNNVEQRDGFIINIDPWFKVAAIRKGAWKLLLGNPSINFRDSWYPPLTNDLTGYITKHQLRENYGKMQKLINGYKTGTCRDIKCYSDVGVRLYNLETNPFEIRNEAKDNPEMVQRMKDELIDKLIEMIDPQNVFLVDPYSVPNATFVDGSSRMGAWKPWM